MFYIYIIWYQSRRNTTHKRIQHKYSMNVCSVYSVSVYLYIQRIDTRYALIVFCIHTTHIYFKYTNTNSNISIIFTNVHIRRSMGDKHRNVELFLHTKRPCNMYEFGLSVSQTHCHVVYAWHGYILEFYCYMRTVCMACTIYGVSIERLRIATITIVCRQICNADIVVA